MPEETVEAVAHDVYALATRLFGFWDIAPGQGHPGPAGPAGDEYSPEGQIWTPMKGELLGARETLRQLVRFFEAEL